MSTPPPSLPGALDVAFLTGAEGVTELVLVRHGQQDLPDMRGRPVADQVDPPLSELGRRQAQVVGERMATERVDAVYASNLQRARDTAAAIAAHHGHAVTVLEDLREIEVFRDVPPDRSALEVIGRTRLMGARQRMIVEKRWDVYPLSERSDEFRHRVVTALEGIAALHPGQRVVVGCHGGVINAYIAHLLGVRADMVFRPAHASVSVVLARDTIRAVHSLNQVHHLASVDPALVTH